MDLKTVWLQNGARDEQLETLLKNGNFDQLQSRLPLRKLRSNLLLGILSGFIVTISYLAILIFFPVWQLLLLFSVLLFFNSLIILDSWEIYKKMPVAITATNSLKQELNAHCLTIENWWAMQKRLSLFVYPIAATAGFIIGGIKGSGLAVEEFLYNRNMLGILAITILIVVPICYGFARWMFHQAYGKHLKKIKSAIAELS